MRTNRFLKGISLSLLAAALIFCSIVRLQSPPQNMPSTSPMVTTSPISSEKPLQSVSGQALTGVVVAVDAGHGGPDGGCVGKNGTAEAPLNLDVAQRLQHALEALGATVVMTRTGDYMLSAEDTDTNKTRKREDQECRVALAQENRADLLVSIHMNSYSDPDISGAQVFYAEGSEQGKLLAQALQSALREELDPNNRRTACSGDYFILNGASASALVECGFLSNPHEESLLNTETYRERIAQAIAGGILTFFRQKAA